MRISLARALFMEPNLLLLDEPTNHLDLNAAIWLDDYLTKWKKTLLIVSHDQDFLNSVCEEVLHLEDLKINTYAGNYDSFKAMHKQKMENAVKAWEKEQKSIRAMKGGNMSKKSAEEKQKEKRREPGGARAKKQLREAIASGQETREKTELLKRPRDYTVTLQFPEVAVINPPVITASEVGFTYPNGTHVFDKLDFSVDMDSRICIVGANGAGKSTLLKLLMGELEPSVGEVVINQRLRLGVYNQHFVDALPMDKSAVDHLRAKFGDATYQECRNRLGKFGLEGHAHEIPLRDLSGGQKARVVFVTLSFLQPHIMLLDEPTNNLDIETIDALCDAINEFNGGVILVSHDARLIESCECQLWVVEHNMAYAFDGEFDAYRACILKEIEEKAAEEEMRRKEKRRVRK